MRDSLTWRSRWAAAGAALAVSVGGGGMFMAQAASSAESSTVSITPVRILDTRTDLGLAGPFVSAVALDLQVTGLISAKAGPAAPAPAIVVPDGATGVLLNVTAVNPTAGGFISVRPADVVGAPATSNLNFDAGDIVPNAVTVALPTSGPDAGKIDITYDAAGVAGPTTEVLVDVVGYMVEAGPGGVTASAVHSSTDGEVVLGFNSPLVLESVELTAPSDGTVIANSSGYVRRTALSGSTIARCSIGTAATIDSTHLQISEIADDPASQQMAGTRGFDVTAGQVLTVNFVCEKGNTVGAVFTDPSLTAIFAPG